MIPQPRSKCPARTGEVLAGSPQDESVRLADKVPARVNETTIFKSLGMAVEDISAAVLVYRSAKNNRGRKES